MEEAAKLTDISLELLEFRKENKEHSPDRLTSIFINCCLDKKD